MRQDAGSDLALLTRWFADRRISADGPLSLTLIAGGRSNLTYVVRDAAGRKYVLRRPPYGSLLPRAHDMEREFTVISALAGTAVPVPGAVALCTDAAVLGAPFYVMDLMPGVVLSDDADGSSFPREVRRPATESLVDVLVALHAIDADAVGLGRLGRRANYLERQLNRWRRQFTEAGGRPLPQVGTIHARLSRSVPPQQASGIVHGDYRFGNVLLGPDGGVTAVLDWELATLGDPLADLGWLAANWREPGAEPLLESPTAHSGWPSRADVVDRYARQTGLDVSCIGWYVAFSHWKLASIMEGVYVRYRRQVMGDDGTDIAAQGELVLRLLTAAEQALDTAL